MTVGEFLNSISSVANFKTRSGLDIPLECVSYEWIILSYTHLGSNIYEVVLDLD